MAKDKGEIDEQLPAFVSVLRTYLRAQFPVATAILRAAKSTDGPLCAALDSFVMDLGYLVSFDEAMEKLIEQTESERFRHILRVLQVSVKAGVDPKDLLVGIVER